MNDIQKLIHEQFIDYGKQLKETEREIIRKFKAGEKYQTEVTKAVDLKEMQKQALIMMESHK